MTGVQSPLRDGASQLGLMWEPALNKAVNKGVLSTGETGELASENGGFGPNPGVELALPRCLSSNRRETPDAETPAQCCGNGRGERRALLSTKCGLGVGVEMYWLPGMDSNHDSRLQRPLSYH